METLIERAVSAQTIIQGGAVLIALACLYVIIVLTKHYMKHTEEIAKNSELRLAAITEQANKAIERNTEAHLQNAQAFTKHEAILTHVIQVLEHKV